MIHYMLLLGILFGSPIKNNKRIIMLFADANSQKQLQIQQKLLAADKPGCNEREIMTRVYTPKDMAIYKKNNIRKGFTILLIGKDGGEKLRSHIPVTSKKLFALIDAMPMRKEVISHVGGYGE